MDIIPVVLWGMDDVLAGVSESDKHLQNYVCSVARRLTEFVSDRRRQALDGLFMYMPVTRSATFRKYWNAD